MQIDTPRTFLVMAIVATFGIGCPGPSSNDTGTDVSRDSNAPEDTDPRMDTERSDDTASADATDAADGTGDVSPDADAADSGTDAADTGSSDTRRPETGGPDTAPRDTASETGGPDTAPGDTAGGDSGTDTGGADSATSDTSGTDGGADADAGGPSHPPAGGVIVTEIMASPTAIPDAQGEYFEVYNTSSTTDYDLDGCTMADRDRDAHIISSPGGLVVPAGGRVTIAKSSMPGFTPDYTFPSSWYLSSSDEILLTCSATRIDAVEYSNWSSGPSSGAALGLDPSVPQTATANDMGSNWCDQTTSLPNTSDKGTPGKPNDSCSP